ncbi:hypothetical protein GCM10025866_23590 [Naasia aerilata]|uniref:Glycogen debranching enzyme GlgX n=1 Tax=Naasia aerilata TaxID=1162966 RepID=A0ABN6XN70_9MICO|nr:hypothetical protein GCM10025866_23590 [Naasia aerilata]
MEGPTDDPEVLTLRAKQQRNFLATMLLSQGVPMILHGDELGRTQGGNNNTYAQDSEISWQHWEGADQPLIEFTAAVARLRKDHPIFRRSRFFDGRPVEREEGAPVPDVMWVKSDGTEMSEQDWDTAYVRSMGMFLNGNGIRQRDVRGVEVTDDDFLVYFNADDDDVEFTLPSEHVEASWDVVVDTAGVAADSGEHVAGSKLTVASKSMMVLRAHTAPEVEPDHSVAASLAVLTAAQTDAVGAAIAAGPKVVAEPRP